VFSEMGKNIFATLPAVYAVRFGHKPLTCRPFLLSAGLAFCVVKCHDK
jgi:hypothetical protein